jgi:hypothetical protein
MSNGKFNDAVSIVGVVKRRIKEQKNYIDLIFIVKYVDNIISRC